MTCLNGQQGTGLDDVPSRRWELGHLWLGMRSGGFHPKQVTGHTVNTEFINIFKKVYDKCIPIRYVKRKVNPSKPWLTEGLMKCIKVKNKLYKERVKSPTPLRIEIYKRYRNKLNSILRATEKGYYETLFQKNKSNLRKSWQIIKYIIGKHKHGPIMSKWFKVNSTEIDDPLIISNRYNEYFVNIGNNLANKIKCSPIVMKNI